MNKAAMAIIGIGVIGAGALILMRSTPISQVGGAFGGGPSKKEEATIESVTETVTETPVEPAAPIYNVVFPDPSFPTIPEAPISEPWWVTSMDPPSKKATSSDSYENTFDESYWGRKQSLSPGVRAGIKRIVEGPPTPTHMPVGGIGQSAAEAKPIKKETVPSGIGFYISQLIGGK